MKKLVLLATICITGIVYAHEFPDAKGLCADVVDDKLQTAQKCVISSGGGAGGMYTILQYGKSKVHIEESTMCPEYDTKGCDIGVSKNDKILGKGNSESYYLRDYKTGKITKSDKGNWTCVKTSNNKINTCYVIK
ncbi:hypothetical protein [Acinetobacter rudis]|uniref:Uncharacterized protein n=1 Tax=Acinetobacter rudis CIP 110305 TaxID=421052 RepID=S3NK80_9GAMM|nr:hypothetical protein [Acinetobacter rudis]EPF74654.1 hypothetical protein F945_01421 [Acinetobacter rudis CIP 110305]